MFSQQRNDLCRQAEVLRPATNQSYESTNMRVYLIGDLDPRKIGRLMYHNKINHHCTVVDQCSQLVKLFHSRPDFTEEFDQASFLTAALNALEKYEGVDKALGIKPCPTCRNDWATLEQLDTVFDPMTLCGPRKSEGASSQAKKRERPA